MKINSLTIKDGYYSKTFNFGIKTAIYSDKNSVGKSTLLRLLFYSIGYSIPSTKKIKFNKLETILRLETEQGNFEIYRRNKKIFLTLFDSEEWQLLLPNDLEFILQKIFNIKNSDVLLNILGAIYLDQDKGWTLLNRGKVIGGIKFNIEQLIQGVANIEDLEPINIELNETINEIVKLKQLKKIVDYQNENFQRITESNFELGKLSDLEQELSIIKGKKINLESEKNKLDATLKKNEEYLSYIESLNLFVKAPESGEEFLLKKEFIKDFGTYQKIIELKIYHLELKLKELQAKEEKIKLEIFNSEQLFISENPIELFENRLNLIVAPKDTIESELLRLNSRKKELIELRQDHLSNEIMQNLYNNIVSFATQLNVKEYLDLDKDFILTSDLKSYSGTILHKLVFCFKLAYVIEIQKFLGASLPIVLDSPSGREVDQKNIADMFNILNNDFLQNQIIIASIHKYEHFQPDTIIEIQKNLLE